MEIDLNKFILNYIHRDIKKLYLDFLYIVEDLRKQEKITESEFSFLRKRILDSGNDCSRDIENQLNNLDIKLIDKYD
jgi:hypothetical protein